ncbi:MAG: type II secretion system F family protein [Geminicoccaceae bacterium]|nr:type II secretion system F family protein [Geminicoccaceae bacterium]
MSQLFSGNFGFNEILVAIIGILTGVSFLFLWMALVERDHSKKRSKILERRRSEIRNQRQENRQRRAAGSSIRLVHKVLAFANLKNINEHTALRLRMQQSGIKGNNAVAIYLFAKLTAPMALGFVSFIVITASHMFEQQMVRVSITMMMVILGFYGPDLVLNQKRKKRTLALQKSLPDGLDLLVICAESGLSLDSSLNRVANELGDSAPELSEELSLASIELNFLPDRKQALTNLAERVNLPAIRGVVNTLIQTEKYGTPLSQSLRVLSAEFREERMLKAEEKAARLPATLTVPMIVFILPTLFIVLAGPAVIDISDTIMK